MTTVHYNNGDYAIFKDTNNLCQFAVFHYTGSFWQQCSNWYFHKGNAIRKFNQLEK